MRVGSGMAHFFLIRILDGEMHAGVPSLYVLFFGRFQKV